jgi:hypothetical protein
MSDQLPIYTHTSVLGVDIGVWQRDQKGVKIETWVGEPYFRHKIRKEISAWARRNLFDGQP